MRLGSEAGSLEIMNHPFFKDINWEKLMSKEIKPSFVPKVSGDAWLKNFDQDFTKEQPKDTVAKIDLDKLKEFQKEFQTLNFNIENEKKQSD